MEIVFFFKLSALTLSLRGLSDVYTYKDTYKDSPRTERVKIFMIAVDPSIGIQMKRKELTKTFMIISNRKNPLVPMVYTKRTQRCKGFKDKSTCLHLETFKLSNFQNVATFAHITKSTKL